VGTGPDPHDHAPGPAQRQGHPAPGSRRASNEADTAIFMAQSTGHPFQVPDEVARWSVHDMTAVPGFGRSLRAVERRGFRDGVAIHVPVTVAPSAPRDRVLLPLMARRRRHLPPQTRWLTPSGLGPIPMFDDPEAVSNLLLQASSSSAAVGAGTTTR
jgi:hypothetical protein